MVSNRSFLLLIVLALIMAGTAQAAPLSNGMIDLPFRPNFLRSPSIIKLILERYPVSSKMEMKANRAAICGIKMMIPPKPAMIPSTSRSFKICIGNSDQEKTA